MWVASSRADIGVTGGASLPDRVGAAVIGDLLGRVIWYASAPISGTR